MNSDSFASHWLSSPEVNAGRPQQQQQQQQQLQQNISAPPPPPLRASTLASVAAPTLTSSLDAGTLRHTHATPACTGGNNSGVATAKYVDATSMAAVQSSAVPLTSAQPGPYYRPPRLQQQQQPQYQQHQHSAPLRSQAHGAATSSSASNSGHTAANSNNTSSKSVNGIAPVHMVNVPITVGTSINNSGNNDDPRSGGSAYHPPWRGSASGASNSAERSGGGRSSQGDNTRRRGGGGRGVAFYTSRRQPDVSHHQHQQQPYQHQQRQLRRHRGGPNGGNSGSGGGGTFGRHPLEPLQDPSDAPVAAAVDGVEGQQGALEQPAASFPQALSSGPVGPVVATATTTAAAATANTSSAAASSLSQSLAGGGTRSARRGSATSHGSGGGGGGNGNGQYPAVDSPFTHTQHHQQQQHLAAATSAVDSSTAAAAAFNASSALQQQSTQQQQQQQQVSRSGVSATAAGAARYTRPHGEERPTVSLSLNVLSVYQAINEMFYQERQKLLAAPAKYAARKYEDTAGHYIPCEGEVIADRYVFKELVGQGSFGKVLRCVDRKYNEPVAVKVIRSGPYFESQGWFEAQVVAHLNSDAALQNLVVQLRKVFLWKGHMVLVFEPLSFSLYKLITLTKHNGVSLDLTRKFAFQMVKVLLVLEQHQPPIIHCDLKPENVLLQDPSRSGVRVIDFGSACYQQQPTWRLPPLRVPLPASSPSPAAGPPWEGGGEEGQCGAAAAATTGGMAATPNISTGSAATATSEGFVLTGSDTTTAAPPPSGASGASHAPPPPQQHQQQQQQHRQLPTTTQASASADVEVVMPKYIQSRYYRSPEVILELGYTTAIDRWSLGCFLAEMHTGRPLFQGNHEADMVAYFTMVLGPLPDYMIAASPKRTRLYHTCPVENFGGDGGGGGGGGTMPPTAAGSPTASDATQVQQALQRQQCAVSPPLALTAPLSPLLTPFHEAPGHAPGSPFFLRTPQVEDGDSATAYTVRTEGDGAPLEKVLGVHTGGPRGCRAGQPGHDKAAYETFYDFIAKLLQYDPRKRLSCEEAMQHPFLEPIRVLEARAAAVAATDTTPPPPNNSASTPPVGGGATGPAAPPNSSDAGNL